MFDVNGQNSTGLTALHKAAIVGNPEMALYLLEHGAVKVPDSNEIPPAELARKLNHEDVAVVIENYHWNGRLPKPHSKSRRSKASSRMSSKDGSASASMSKESSQSSRSKSRKSKSNSNSNSNSYSRTSKTLTYGTGYGYSSSSYTEEEDKTQENKPKVLVAADSDVVETIGSNPLENPGKTSKARQRGGLPSRDSGCGCNDNSYNLPFAPIPISEKRKNEVEYRLTTVSHETETPIPTLTTNEREKANEPATRRKFYNLPEWQENHSIQSRSVNSPIFDALNRRDTMEAMRIIKNDESEMKAKDDIGATPMHYAARLGLLQFIKELVIRHIPVDMTDSNEQTPLHYAADAGKTSVYNFLLASGADKDRQDANNETPAQLNNKRKLMFNKFMDCCSNGDLKEVSRIAGLYPAFIDEPRVNDLKTPLVVATESGKEDVVTFLADNAANISYEIPNKGTVVARAIKYRQIRIARMLLNRGASTGKPDKNGNTILHIAILNHDFDIVDVLTDIGLKPNEKNKEGNTPLHIALEEKNLPLFKKLLGVEGADVNIQGKDGMTPLHIATKYEMKDAILYLTALSAKAGIRDNSGKTPADYAMENLDKPMEKYLRELE